MGGARALTSHWMPAKTCEVGEVGAVSAFCIGVRGSERSAACSRSHSSGVLVPASAPFATAWAGASKGSGALSPAAQAEPALCLAREQAASPGL